MQVPYLVTHCKRGHRTQFPQSMSEPPLQHLIDPSTTALSVAVSCYTCTRAENHTIESRPVNIGTEDTVEYQIERPTHGFVCELVCVEGDSCIPLKVIAPRSAAMT